MRHARSNGRRHGQETETGIKNRRHARKQWQENRAKRHETETANMTKKTETATWTGDKDMRQDWS